MWPKEIWLCISLVAVILQHGSTVFAKKIFCYYSSFAQTRHSVGNFLPENINPFLCTHIIYAFVDISTDGRDLRPFNRNDHGQNGLYARTLALKEKNPDLKVLLAVGGWQIGSKPFIPMIKDEYTRSVWIGNVISYLRRHGFDGFDVDWEFPATRGSPADDKYRFTLLMKGLYEAFEEEARESGKEKLLLTMATASGTYYIDQSYEPSKIINYIDYMLLMTYNYHGQWEKVTGHHSGLYPHKNDPKSGEKAQLYQEWSIDYWLNVGISKDKLIVGLPTYGMSFTLADPSDHGLHAPAAGGGKMGDYTRETGILGYYEICLNLKDKGWQSEWIDDQAVPYAYGGDQWAGYENKKSIAIKSNNIMTRDLAGAFVWSVEMDDFGGVCGEGQYPLLSTIVEIIGGGSPSQPAARQAANQHRPRHGLAEVVTPQKPPPHLSAAEKAGANPQLKKLKRKLGWATTSRTPVPEPDTTTPKVSDTTTPDSDPATKPPGWWSQKLWKKARQHHPKTTTTQTTTVTASPAPAATQLPPAPKNGVRKSGAKNRPASLDQPKDKVAHEFVSSEVHEVKSWQTTPWWSGGAPKLRPGDGQFYLNAMPTGRPGFGLQKEPTPSPTPATTPSPAAEDAENAEAEDYEYEEIEIDCRLLGVGTFADPSSCEHFIICLGGGWMNFPPHIMSCPSGTRFDPQLKICNYAEIVPCNL
ncbi:acidic mammalian chitinase-like [Physella acuta]|uniref:acidic mammalian chitinase-like n=1 Tax=Physella acuta TaxID=109671 RepID=UPI0027DAE727|nr:acidic mammalian chitinase-like [Physella acuta]